MMTPVEFLCLATASELKDLARANDVPRSGGRSTIAEAILNRLEVDPHEGSPTAYQQLFPYLGTDLLQSMLDGSHFEGLPGRQYYAEEAALSGLSKAELRRLALAVAEAKEGEALDELLRTGVYAKLYAVTEDRNGEFVSVGAGTEDGDEDSDDANAAAAREEGTEPGEFNQDDDEDFDDDDRYSELPVSYSISPGEQAPEGFTFKDRPLLKHQEEALANLRTWHASAKGGETGILCLPTGGGKTRVAVQFVLDEVVAKGGRALWVTHRRELIDQALGSFIENSGQAARPYSLGRFQKGALKVDSKVDVTVASINTLVHRQDGRTRNFDRLRSIQGNFDVVIVDECHHAVAKTWKGLLKRLADKGTRILGLSATPTRTTKSEKSDLWRIFNKLVHETTVPRLIREGVLAKPVVHTVDTHLRFNATAKEQRDQARFRDLPKALVSRISHNESRNRSILKAYIDGRAKWGSTIFFAATKDQGNALLKGLTEAGVKANALYSDASAEERTEVVKAFADRRLEALVNVRVFSEGTDLPHVNSVFIAAPTKSEILFRQMVGRGMRGPAINGTETCNIVSFHDALSGLDGVMTSNFSSSAQALQALGLEQKDLQTDEASPQTPPGLPGAEPAARSEDGTKDQLLQAQLRELKAWLASLPVNEASWHSPAPNPLLGWWQVVGLHGIRYLPVFRSDAGAAWARVGAVQALPVGESLQEEGLPELQLVSWPVWSAFQHAMLHRSAPAEYVDLSRLPLIVAKEAVNRLLGETPVPGPGAAELRERATVALAIAGKSAIQLKLSDGSIEVTEQELATLTTAWDALKAVREPIPDESHVRLFVWGAVTRPEFAGIAPDRLTRILTEAARSGRLPDRVTVTAPTLPEVARAIRGLAQPELNATLDATHQAFFAGSHATREEFLMALLTTSANAAAAT